MNYRRLGRSGLQLSSVGFGTAQFRMISERQAIETLHRGFELGVNLVHTAPDYGGAEDIVAKAVATSRHKVIVCSQAYDRHNNFAGPVDHFERLFEATCEKFGTGRLELFGIACIDDREAFLENVWGSRGMVEFLLRKKQEGRIGSIFCTTHGGSTYLRRLIESDVFDALMIAYNALGFHLLSYHPPSGRQVENVAANREIIRLAGERNIGIMVMKPVAGGLLCRGQAFPRRDGLAPTRQTASEVLRNLLVDPGIACAIIGTASVAEAEENAQAGWSSGPGAAIELPRDLCSRCGHCDDLCSKQLPVSWLFRAAYVSLIGSETFETWKEVEYFTLHPAMVSSCASCTDQTCYCPVGIQIPKALINLHQSLRGLMDAGLVLPPPQLQEEPRGSELFAMQVVHREIPSVMRPGERRNARVFIENRGTRGWFAAENEYRARVHLLVCLGRNAPERVHLRQDTHPLQRAHFSFDLTASRKRGEYPLRLVLVGEHENFSADRGLEVYNGTLIVDNERDYGVAYLSHNVPPEMPTGITRMVWVSLSNTGSRSWVGIDIALFLDGQLLTVSPLPSAAVHPGESVTVSFRVSAPDPGRHTFKLQLVEQNVAWFEDYGIPPFVIPFTTKAALPQVGPRLEPWHYSPSAEIYWRADGSTYPSFLTGAKGCMVVDASGREYVDYVMGWGSAFLGYAHPRIQQALSESLLHGCNLTMPHRYELDLAEQLRRRIPCAEAVLFGKNGSDVTTAAARMARAFTGRGKILYSGYLGWQDWNREGTGQSFRFNLRDLEPLRLHSGDIAAIMIEPAAQVESLNGPIREADISGLRQIRQIADSEGALLVFDEIMTGFRYPGGSVQQASGVTPDLACFGKALGGGLPFAALVGRREIFDATMARIDYHPTYKSESYSFAAALAALQILDEEDVAGHVWNFGETLKAGLNELCAKASVPVRITGVPFRMTFCVDDGPALMRTLIHQELLRQGVITFKGILMPSYAHDDMALSRTLAAFSHVLQTLTAALRKNDLAPFLEIPEVC